MTKPYVARGPEFMGMFSERHLYFDVDEQLAKRYNENYQLDRNFCIGFIVFGICLFLLCGWLFSIDSILKIIISALCVIIGITSFILGILGAKRIGTATAMLKRGILNPAIIAQIDGDGIGILILAETSTGWVTRSMKLKELPPVHEKKIGELIPVTCPINCVSADLIAWGTADPAVIKAGIDGISDAEWNAIRHLMDRYDFKPEYSDEQLIKVLKSEDIQNFGL